MGQMIGVVAALVIGGLFLTTMMATLFNMQANSRDIANTVPLHQNAERLSNQLHDVLAMQGLNIKDGTSVVSATTTQFKFKTCWNFDNDSLSTTVDTIRITYDNTPGQLGKKMIVTAQGPSGGVRKIGDFESIQWLKDINFVYYDVNGSVTATTANIRSLRLDLSFEKASSTMGKPTIKNKVSLWSYFKNLYLPAS
jgi:hypothetical protein